jgi:hypothetical protein
MARTWAPVAFCTNATSDWPRPRTGEVVESGYGDRPRVVLLHGVDERTQRGRHGLGLVDEHTGQRVALLGGELTEPRADLITGHVRSQPVDAQVPEHQRLRRSVHVTRR